MVDHENLVTISCFRTFLIFNIGECGSTLYVGLSGIVRNLIQKSTGWDHTFLSIFFLFFLGMSRAGVNTKDAMKKQIRRIHSVFSHVDP